MADFTSKKEAIAKLEALTRPLSNETFLQINMVGLDWLFVQANDDWYIRVTLDAMRNTLDCNVYNRNSDSEQSYYFNLRRPTTEALKEMFVDMQNKRIYKIN